MFKSLLLVSILVLVLAALASAQQPIAPNCTLTDTKPQPVINKLHLESCIVVQLATYLTFNNSYLHLNNATVNANLSSCTVPNLVIDFDCGQLNLEFANNASIVHVKSLAGKYTLQNTTGIFSNSTPRFSTSAPGHYYKCDAEQNVPVGGTVLEPKITQISFSHLAMEAYRNVSGTDFYQIAEECSLDSQPVSDFVRIGVGVCLVALVIIVLIAYFVGRRRWSERSTYESV